jgi:hypothetical protein
MLQNAKMKKGSDKSSSPFFVRQNRECCFLARGRAAEPLTRFFHMNQHPRRSAFLWIGIPVGQRAAPALRFPIRLPFIL